VLLFVIRSTVWFTCARFMNEACHITDMHMRAVFFRDIAEIDRVSESAREIDVETVRKSNLSSRSPVDMRIANTAQYRRTETCVIGPSPRVPGAKPSLSQALSQPQRPVRPSALSSGSSGWSTRPPPTPRPGAAPAASPAPSPSPAALSAAAAAPACSFSAVLAAA